MKHFHACMCAALVGVLCAASASEGGQGSPPPGPPVIVAESRDARETRERLRTVLDQYPPSVREVLRIDPTLLARADYLATYPVLATFLQQHPEVAHNPAYFVGTYRAPEPGPGDPASEGFRAVSRVSENLMVVLIIATITGGVLWLVRTIVEQRRWLRASRAQMELHTKLIDRFSTSEDLLAYLQSSAGRVFTEVPALLQPAPRAMGAPLGRIFWSLQSGTVVGALGIGLIIVSRSAASGIADVLYGVGIVTFVIGVGFAVSAAVSYYLSQRLGLVQPLSAQTGEAQEP